MLTLLASECWALSTGCVKTAIGVGDEVEQVYICNELRDVFVNIVGVLAEVIIIV